MPTITEALAEIKTIGKRIEKKRAAVELYLYRQERFKDPLEKEGGSRAYIAQEIQALGDMEERIIAIRRAIAKANAESTITVGGKTRSIQDWLTWRREIAPGRQTFYRTLTNSVSHVRKDAAGKGIPVVASADQVTGINDVIVNMDETEIAKTVEGIEETLGVLDGQLSLRNATITVEV